MSQTNLLLKNAASKIGGAMDKIKFDDSLSTEDFQKIRADVEAARDDLNMFSDINQDPTGMAAVLGRSIELMDRTLQTLDLSHNLI
jgi:hypothetical protein